MPLVLVALGSNLGDRKGNLSRAVDALATALAIEAASSVYETEPMYVEDQPPFLNAALRGRTELSPRDLLARLKTAEQQIGRLPRARFGPREIDLDLIAYGRMSYRYGREGLIELELPHPRIAERRFVLEPLAEVDNGLIHNLSQMLEETKNQADGINRTDFKLLLANDQLANVQTSISLPVGVE